MFSVAQKRSIAEAVEKALSEIHHPEMPVERPRFHLHVDGVESWSFAEIDPNWTFDDARQPGINPWNEQVAVQMNADKDFSRTQLPAAIRDDRADISL